MLANRPLVLDLGCEMREQLMPCAEKTFWSWDQHSLWPNSVTVISRQTLIKHSEWFRDLMQQKFATICLVNPTEGSQTMLNQCKQLDLLTFVKQKRLVLVGCGDMEPEIACMWYDCYRYKPYDYAENIEQCNLAGEIFSTKSKPYQFLFLNGRTRPHRKYLIERLSDQGLLSRSLWSNLDTTPVPDHTNIYGDICQRPSRLRLLPPQYEVPRYQHNLNSSWSHKFVKSQLFDQDWGEIYIHARPYIDTYFSLVTETVFDYPYSLRSEKIYKPIAMGHPWIAAANRGFYRDLRDAGFRTFDTLIDESFDLIDDNHTRLERIVSVVQDLCAQDLDEFLQAAEEICKYNQQHMLETGPKIKQAFVSELDQFIRTHSDAR